MGHRLAQQPLSDGIVRLEILVPNRPFVTLVKASTLGEVVRGEGAGHGARPIVGKPAKRETGVPLGLWIGGADLSIDIKMPAIAHRNTVRPATSQ